MFSMQTVSINPLICTFQLSFAASLNLGRSQNHVLKNGLNFPSVITGSLTSTINKAEITTQAYRKISTATTSLSWCGGGSHSEPPGSGSLGWLLVEAVVWALAGWSETALSDKAWSSPGTVKYLYEDRRILIYLFILYQKQFWTSFKFLPDILDWSESLLTELWVWQQRFEKTCTADI